MLYSIFPCSLLGPSKMMLYKAKQGYCALVDKFSPGWRSLRASAGHIWGFPQTKFIVIGVHIMVGLLS